MSGTKRAAFLSSVLLCLAHAAPALAANANSDSRVDILQGLSVTQNSDLDFGDFVASANQSIFRMDPSTGVLTQRSGNALSVGGSQSPASFTANGIPLLRVRITVAENRIDLVRDGGSETMRVNRFRFDGPRNRFLDAGGQATYQVGGQLRINANQASGTYRGNFTVTIDYQ